MWGWPSTNKGYIRLCRTQNPMPHCGPLDPEWCGLSPFLQPPAQIPTPVSTLLFLVLPHSTCFLPVPMLLFVSGSVHKVLLCQEPLPHSLQVASFTLSSQLQWHFLRETLCHPLACCPQFSPSLHFRHFLLRTVQVLIVDHPPRLCAWCRSGACVHFRPRNTQ